MLCLLGQHRLRECLDIRITVWGGAVFAVNSHINATWLAILEKSTLPSWEAPWLQHAVRADARTQLTYAGHTRPSHGPAHQRMVL